MRVAGRILCSAKYRSVACRVPDPGSRRMNGSRSSREGAIRFFLAERMSGGRENDQRIVGERRRDDVELVRRLTHDVEIVEIEPHPLQDLLAVDHFERELDFGVGAAEFADQPGGEILRRGDHRDPHAAALQPLHFRQFHAEQVEPLEHVPARRGDGPARVGQKEPLADLLMQRQVERLATAA